MPVDKPQPLMVNNQAYYTLTSYEPVQVTVHVAHPTPEEIDMGLEAMLGDLGATPADRGSRALWSCARPCVRSLSS